MGTLSVADTVVNVIGFGAGVLVSGSLVPQIYRAHKRRSTLDLSYFWQVIIAVGVVMQLVYLAYFTMWSVFVPLTVLEDEFAAQKRSKRKDNHGLDQAELFVRVP